MLHMPAGRTPSQQHMRRPQPCLIRLPARLALYAVAVACDAVVCTACVTACVGNLVCAALSTLQDAHIAHDVLLWPALLLPLLLRKAAIPARASSIEQQHPAGEP